MLKFIEVGVAVLWALGLVAPFAWAELHGLHGLRELLWAFPAGYGAGTAVMQAWFG